MFIEKIHALAKAINEKYADDPEERKYEVDFVLDQLNHFPDYVNSVVRMEYALPLIRATREPEEVRERTQQFDRARRYAHDAAIDAINILNRDAKSFGIEPFFEVNTKSRYAVAEFVGQFCNEAYSLGCSKEYQMDLQSNVAKNPTFDTAVNSLTNDGKNLPKLTEDDIEIE